MAFGSLAASVDASERSELTLARVAQASGGEMSRSVYDREDGSPDVVQRRWSGRPTLRAAEAAAAIGGVRSGAAAARGAGRW